MVKEVVDYQGLMDGPVDISKVFTLAGMDAFDQAVEKGNSQGDKDRCVMGESKEVTPASTRSELQARYYREYAVKWREFLAACKIRPFGGADDATRRLNAIADAGKSPMLRVIKLIAMNAPAPPPGETGISKTIESVKKTLGSKDPVKDTQIAGLGLPGVAAPPTRKADLQTTLMQPALFVVPPPFDHTVNDNDGAYVKGLRDLANAIEGLARAAQPEQAAKAGEAEAALAKAREAHTGLTDRFSRFDPAGLADPMTELLAQPIRFAAAIVKQPIKPPTPSEPDVALRQLCAKLKPTLASYPFNPDSEKDSDPQSVKEAFAPKNGLIWKYAEPSSLVARQSVDWQEKPGLPGYHVSPELLRFLNAAQQLTDALVPGGEVHAEYTLRPCSAHPECDGLKLTLDGKEMSPGSVMQVPFSWPAASPDRRGADAMRVSPFGYGLGHFNGLWGVFRLFQSADARPLGSARVTWSEIRGRGKAIAQKLTPPAQVDLVGLTPRTDVLNPSFFKDLQTCPNQAIARN
jgi:type VI secretion system protein ImpL